VFAQVTALPWLSRRDNLPSSRESLWRAKPPVRRLSPVGGAFAGPGSVRVGTGPATDPDPAVAQPPTPTRPRPGRRTWSAATSPPGGRTGSASATSPTRPSRAGSSAVWRPSPCWRTGTSTVWAATTSVLPRTPGAW